VSGYDLTRELERKHVDYEVIPHRRTEAAKDEAAAIGVEPRLVAKTVVLIADTGYVRTVLPASERLDLHKLRELIDDGKRTRLATESELARVYPMFELGAVPPFGGPAGDQVIVDRRLAERDSVVLEAGSHSESIQMRTADLLTVTGATVADLAADVRSAP
jgi:Ala-tRNA(Pro) deacylase